MRPSKKGRGRVIGVAVAVIGLLGATWLWQTLKPVPPPPVGQVNVEGLPLGGILFVDGEQQSDTVLALAPGSYVFRIVAEGFEEMTDTVEVASGSRLTFPFTGRAVPGTVIVEELPAGGEVFLDGTRQSGSTFEAPPGSHEIVMSAAGFRSVTDTVDLTAGGETRLAFTGRRTPAATGTVVVQGLPPGGVILVDGRRQSGSRFSATTGRHQIQMSATGYETVNQTIRIAAGRTISVEFTGEVLPVVLWVKVFPTANLTLDGISQGEVNQRQFSVTPNRRHSFRFERANYVPFDTTVTLLPGVVDTLDIRLEQRRP